MRNGYSCSCQQFQIFLGEESTFLNGKDWIFSTKLSSIFVLVGAGNFFLNKQKEKWKEHFAAPLSVKVIFLLLLFVGHRVGKVTSGIWQLISIEMSSKTSSQLSRAQTSPREHERERAFLLYSAVQLPFCSLKEAITAQREGTMVFPMSTPCLWSQGSENSSVQYIGDI